MFNRNEHRTPSQRAQKAIMNIIARLAGCAFLIYFVVKLLMTPTEETPGTTTATIMAIVLLVLAAVVIGMTVFDLMRGLKSNRFSASTYEEQDLAEYLANKEAEASTCACEDGQQEIESHTDDTAVADPDKKDSADL